MDSETFNEEQINSTENGSTNVKQRVKERNRSQSSLNSNTDINDPENLDYEEEDGPKTFNKNNSSAEENNRQEKLTAGSDEEGELDEADLEDGEIHDTNPNKSKSNELEQENVESVEISKIRASPPPTSRGPCRFFLQGRCHWGSNCKYGHSNGEQMKSLSNEVSPTKANLSPTGPQKIVGGKTNWISPSIPTTPQTHFFPNVHVLGATNVSTGPSAGTESAWERGLRSAKTLREQSMRRKQEDKDFNEKKYNLSVRHATDEKPIDEHCHEVESQRNDSNVIEDRNYPDRFHSSSFTNFPNNHRANRSNNFNHDRRRNDKFPMKNSVRNEEFVTSQKRRPSQKQYSTGALNGDENSSHFHGSNRRADDWQDPWDRSRNHRNPTYRRRASSSRKPSYSSSSRSSSSSSHSRSSSSSSSSRSRSRSRRRSSPGNRPRRLSETMKNGTEKKSVPNSPPSTNKFLPGRQISSHTLKKAEKSSNQSHSSSNHHRKNSSKQRSRKSRAESESSSSSSSSSDTDHRRASTSSSSSSTSENETPASTVPKSKSASKPTSKNATEKSVNKQEISSTGGNAAATRNSKTDSSKKRRDTSSSTGSASTSNNKKAKLISDSQKSSGDSPNDSESKLKKQKLLREIHEAENLISQRSTKTSS